MKLKTNKTNQNLAMYRESSTDFISSASASLFTGGWLLGIEEINRHPFVFFCNLFKHYTYFSLFG